MGYTEDAIGGGPGRILNRRCEMKKVSLLSLVLFLALTSPIPIQTSALYLANGSDPWMQKPVLSYLLLTEDQRLKQESWSLFAALNLSEEEMRSIQQIARVEQAQLQDLYAKTQAIALNESLSLADKQEAIQATHYNERVLSTMMETDQRLRHLLGSRYPIFRNWIYEWWQREQGTVAQLKGSGYPQDQPTPSSVAYSCWVFATQYYGYTNYEIALPDKAEYAYFYGYNGGRDQFGRIVTNPSSVDLTPSVAAALGLGYLQNSWLRVYYYDLP